MKRRYSGFLLMLTLMFAVILGFIPGLETAMTVHAEEESEVSEESSEAEGVIASGTCGENLTWTLENNGTLTISGTGEMENYESSTDWYDYNPTPWCSYAKSINSIIINNGVTSIGNDAFEEFSCLTTVSIPNSVTRIGYDAFYKCKSLAQIVIPDSVVTIGSGVFGYCDELLQVELSNNITRIPDSTFRGCSNINMVNIPIKCTSIGEYAFYRCSSLETITIPDSMESIGKSAFLYCEKLTYVIFEGTLPAIGEDCFGLCNSLKAVYVDSLEAWLEGEFKGTILNNGVDLYINGTVMGSTLVIPDGVEIIPAYAFAGTKITKVIMPDSVEVIGTGCFSYCTNLREIEFSANLRRIEEFAFCNCNQLDMIIFPAFITDEDTYIGDDAFSYCSSLKKVFFEGNYPGIDSEWRMGNVGPSSYDGAVSSNGAFWKCTFMAYYPQSNTTWTEKVFEKDYGRSYGGEITWIGYESDLTTPSKPYKIANVVSGVHVYWNAVDGVTKYGLWRSETGANGSYKWMGNPTTNHFTDTKVESGKTYYYCVSTCNPKTNAHSIISEPLGITYVSTPDITNRMNLAAGVKLTWNKINGATGYAIYRKPYTGNAAWVRVTTISGNETFTWTDKSVASANGTVYRYTIRALAGTNMKTLSGCRNTGRTMARLTSRTLNSVTKTAATSVKCTWTTTVQASGYEVRFMNGSTVVKQFTVGNYKTGAKTFTGIPTGANYKVQVRSYKKVDGVGVFYSAWSTPKYVNL